MTSTSTRVAAISTPDTAAARLYLHLAAVAAYAKAHQTPPPLPDAARIDPAIADGPRAIAPTDEHYALRTQELRRGVGRSALQVHQNWVKTVLFESALDHLAATHVAGGAGAAKLPPKCLSVLDLCCGRGGDLHKYAAIPAVGRLVCADSCFEAVAEAAARYAVGAGLSRRSTREGQEGVPAGFIVQDCFSPVVAAQAKLCVGRIRAAEDAAAATAAGASADSVISAAATGGFDLVVCNFSMHYAFEKESTVRGFLVGVSMSLPPGGLFIGTTVDDVALAGWRERVGDEFGNGAFKVAFLSPDAAAGAGTAASSYGAAYRFTLQDSVQGAVEWVVDWDNFVRLCGEYNLRLVASANFQDAPARLSAAERLPKRAFLANAGGGAAKAAGAKRGRGGADGDGDEAAAPMSPADGGAVAPTPDEEDAIALFRYFIFEKAA